MFKILIGDIILLLGQKLIDYLSFRDVFPSNKKNTMLSCYLPSQIVNIPKNKTKICILYHRKKKVLLKRILAFSKHSLDLHYVHSSHKMRNCCCPLCKTCEFVEFAFSVFNPIIY